MENSRLTKMLESAKNLGLEGRVVLSGLYRVYFIPDTAVEKLFCNSRDISEEFVGDGRIDWSEVVVGTCFSMRGGRFVVAEVDELAREAWLIREDYLQEAN